MEVRILRDSVEISGYVNAIERNSKPLMSRIGRFIERILKGAFSNALKRNDDVHVLLNHDWVRDLGSQKKGNLTLREDNIGLYAKTRIEDAEVIEKARAGKLVGWSFGFYDVDGGVVEGTEQGLPLRMVKDLDLREVSILDDSKVPAYDGTLIMARADNDVMFYGETFVDEVSTSEEVENIREKEQPKQDEPEAIKKVDLSEYENWVKGMKGETK